jgi:hypothetical protein
MGEISKCCRNLFVESHKHDQHQHQQQLLHATSSSDASSSFALNQINNFWLLTPLISNLPPLHYTSTTVQAKVLEEAASMLENGPDSRKEIIQQK